MAKKEAAASGQVKARVLRDCELGKCDDVVLVDADQVESLFGAVDAHPDAVAYAESLSEAN